MTDDAPMIAKIVRYKDDPQWIIGWVMGYPAGPWHSFHFEFPGKTFAEGEAPLSVGGQDHRDYFDSEEEATEAVHYGWAEQEAYMRKELGDDWKEWYAEAQKTEPMSPGAWRELQASRRTS